MVSGTWWAKDPVYMLSLISFFKKNPELDNALFNNSLINLLRK